MALEIAIVGPGVPERVDRRARWKRRLRRLLVGLLVGLLIVAVAFAAAFVVIKPFRVSVLTLTLVPELLNVGPRPLSAFTPAPRRESVTYGAAVADRMDLYLPATSPADLGTPARYPALLLVLGVNPVPLDDERVIRTATAIARLGFVVAAPESLKMRNWEISPDEPAHLVEAFEVVAARPEVDANRIGMAAFSVGAAVALLAATHPQIAERVRYINAFGGFGDAERLLVESATRSMVVSGQPRPWKMGNLAREMFLRVILRLVDDEVVKEQVRLRVEPIIRGDGANPSSFDPAFAATLTGDALEAYRLATATTVATAEAALAALSGTKRETLVRLSVNRVVGFGVRAPVYLMHDEGDTAIPFSQLGPLASAIAPPLLKRVTEFRFFDHVEPGGSISFDAIPELLKLNAHLNEVLRVAL